MRIVVINVNTTESMTDAIHRQAALHASPDTEIVTLTPFFGPAAVEDEIDMHHSAVAVMNRILAVDEPFDAVVEAGFGEQGAPAIQRLVDVPVISITDAAVATALLLGRRFSVVTTVPEAVTQIEDQLLVAGTASRCASVRCADIGVLDLENDRENAFMAVVEQARQAVNDDRADVVCLGCAGMAGLAERVSADVQVPVVDGVSAAVKQAEALHALGLRPRASAPAAHRRGDPTLGRIKRAGQFGCNN